MSEFQVEGESVFFWLRVKPRAGRERLHRNSSGEICLDVLAPPVEGKANEACVQFFSRTLRLPQACVVILSGRKSRRKRVRVTGHSAQETIELLTKLAARS